MCIRDRINIIRSQKYPEIYFSGSYIYGRPGIDKIANKWMSYWFIGLSTHWNILDWKKTKHQLQQAELSLEEMRLTRKEIENFIELDIKKAKLYFRNAVEKLSYTEKLLNQAKENFRLIENGFKNGVNTNTEFLDAQLELTKARILKTQAIIDVKIQKANLKRALGKNKL